jgi:hypothetical protein
MFPEEKYWCVEEASQRFEDQLTQEDFFHFPHTSFLGKQGDRMHTLRH